MMSGKTSEMTQPTLTISQVKCQRCGYEWLPRKQKPIACPQCSSRAWDGSKEREKTNTYSFKCLRCSYEWTSYKEAPRTCPNCRSRHWNEEKVVYPENTCLQCGYKWIPRNKYSAVCPACHSNEWDKEPYKPPESDELSIAEPSSRTQTTLIEDEEEQQMIMKSIMKGVREVKEDEDNM